MNTDPLCWVSVVNVVYIHFGIEGDSSHRWDGRGWYLVSFALREAPVHLCIVNVAASNNNKYFIYRVFLYIK